MIFQKRQRYIGPFTGNALGDTVEQQISREFLISDIVIVVDVTVSAGMATPAPDGLAAIIKRITLQVTDGARNRNVVDVSGPGLLEYNDRMRGLDLETMINLSQTTGTGSFRLFYRIPFVHDRLSDPVKDYFLLPTNRFSTDPQLTIVFGSQSDIDQDASPTFAVSALSYTILINRVVVGVDEWPIFDQELIEASQAYPSSLPQAPFNLPTPGTYTEVLVRGYAGVAPNIVRSYNVTTNGDYQVEVLGTVLRKAQPDFIFSENLQTRADWWQSIPTPVLTSFNSANTGDPGSVLFDFLSDGDGRQIGDFGSALDVNGLIKTGANARILIDVAGGSGVLCKFFWRRIYGNLGGMKRALKLVAAAANTAAK